MRPARDAFGLALATLLVLGCGPQSVGKPCTGAVVIQDEGDLASFVERGCVDLLGTLSIEQTGLSEVRIPALTHVFGLTVTHNTALETLELPSLTWVGSITVGGFGITISDNPVLTSVEMPDLAEFDWELELARNTALTHVRLPTFGRGGLVRVVQNDSLVSVELPAARRAIAVIEDNPSLTEFAMPLQDSGGLVIRNNAALVSVEAPLLETWRLEIERNPMLETVTVPAFVGGDVAIRDNAVLSALRFDRIVLTKPFEVGRNPKLRELDLLAPTSPEDTLSTVLTITDNAALQRVHVQGATSLAGVTISRNPELTNLSLPALAAVGRLFLWRSGLEQLSLPALVNGTVLLYENARLENVDLPRMVSQQLVVSDNPALTTLTLPALTSVYPDRSRGMDDMDPAFRAGLSISCNAELREVSLPVLVNGLVETCSNPLLATIRMPEFEGTTEVCNLPCPAMGSVP